jgi:hypothetical protein
MQQLGNPGQAVFFWIPKKRVKFSHVDLPNPAARIAMHFLPLRLLQSA